MVDVGDKAPAFSLTNQFGKTTSLSDYEGKWLAVWWIPSTMADMTAACCDTSAKGFGQAMSNYPQVNVVGLSFDTPYEMKKFATRGSILFPLLADTTKEVGEAYGARRYDDWDVFPKKMAFLVNPEGVIEKVYRNIDPDLFVDELVYDLDQRGIVDENTEERSLYRRMIGK